MDSITRTIAAIVLAAGITALIYMDDQMAGETKKNARYTRLFITASGIGWFLMPIIVRQFVGIQNGTPIMMGAGPPMPQQHFNVGPSPF